MCRGFKLTKQDDYFRVTFEAAGALVKTGLNLKPNQHQQTKLTKMSLSKSVIRTLVIKLSSSKTQPSPVNAYVDVSDDVH